MNLWFFLLQMCLGYFRRIKTVFFSGWGQCKFYITNRLDFFPETLTICNKHFLMTTFLVKGHSTFFLCWFLSNESVGRALGLVIGKMIAEAVDKVGAAGGPDHELTQPIHICHPHILESLVHLFISYSLHCFSRAISKFLFLIFLAFSIFFYLHRILVPRHLIAGGKVPRPCCITEPNDVMGFCGNMEFGNRFG